MPPIPDSLFYGRLRHYNILVWRFLGVGQPVALKTLALNGNATLVGGNYIQLRSITSQAGSAFTPTPYTLGPNRSFGMAFIYAIAQGTPADGFAFVAQNTPFGPNYLGLGGSGLGSFTLDPGPAIAATFDYYSNAYTGSPANTVAIAEPRAQPLVSTLWGQDLVTKFGGQAYFGFTGGTGALSSQQYILAMSVAVLNRQRPWGALRTGRAPSFCYQLQRTSVLEVSRGRHLEISGKSCDWRRGCCEQILCSR